MPHDPNANYSSTTATKEEVDRLQVGIEGTTVSWTCPRCQAEFSDELQTDKEVFGFEVKSMGGPDEGMLDLVCECGTKHGGGDQANCGFAVRQPVKRA